LFFNSCSHAENVLDKVEKQKDSISIWIKKSYNDSLSNDSKLSFLNKAYQNILLLETDSIKPLQLSTIAYRFFELKDTTSFFKANKKTLNLAQKRKDSFVIGDAHWSYANYYDSREAYSKAYYHYNTAYKYFDLLNKKYQKGRMLYAMAFIKGRFRDYTGSEVFTFEAIKIFEILENSSLLFDCYNHLGQLQIDIKKYDDAIKYFEKASSFIPTLTNKKNYRSWLFNNIGLAYLSARDFYKARDFFEKSIQNNIQSDLKNYSAALDNRAIASLKLEDTINVKNDLFKALKIRDSINHKAGILSSKIRISEYYEFTRDTLNSIKYAIEANKLAKSIKNGADYLTTLKQLADLQPHKAKEYLHLYSNFSDSLTNAERKTLNKFTRIEFETDEIIETNEILTKQRVWIFSASIGLILILSLLYFIHVQKVKNEKLFLETEQQKANEQVYLLTLKQQATLEEEKTKERNRISQELHDGILGRLFGTRVGLGFLDLNADETTQEQHEAFLEELQDIEKEIREVSHKLNDNFASPDVNFTTIVTQLLESKSQIGDFQFHLNIDDTISWKSTDEIIKVNVYRIIQETLQNTIKHAKAKNVTLDFSFNEKELSVFIKDDGVGFNQKKSRKGIGLKNMKSRVEKLHGTLEINSAVNKGTQIHIKIPVV